MKIFICQIIFIFTFFCGIINAEQNKKLADIDYFRQANEYYKTANYQQALDSYYKIKNKNSAVYFNIGNCYFKLNQKGRALYFYRLAKSINPLNSKINENIRMVRTARQDKFLTKKNTLSALIENFINSYSLRFAFILFSLFLWLTCIFTVLRIFYKKRIFTILIIVNLLILFGAFIFLSFKLFEPDEAILIENNVSLKAEPLENAAELAKLNDATEVKIINYLKNWVEVIVAETHKGYLPKTSLFILKK